MGSWSTHTCVRTRHPDPSAPPVPLAARVPCHLRRRPVAQVHAWVKDKRQMQLRAARQLARKLFDMADDDSSGFLDKDEVIQVSAGSCSAAQK